VLKRILFVALISLTALVLAATGGCSKRHRVLVESNTCWNGDINGDQNINGCGNSTYRVTGPLRCVRVYITTTNGFVHVRIDDQPWATTPDQYGVVQACD
jgi:hypothetical protein